MNELTQPTGTEQTVADVDASADDSDQAADSQTEPDTTAEVETATEESDTAADVAEAEELDLGLGNAQNTSLDQQQNAASDTVTQVEELPTPSDRADQSTVVNESEDLDLGLDNTRIDEFNQAQNATTELTTPAEEQPEPTAPADQSTLVDDANELDLGLDNAQGDELNQAAEPTELGPMLESQKVDVERALKDSKLPPHDQTKIIDALMREDRPTGKEAADLIAKGHLKDADNYSKVLSQLKSNDDWPAAMMALNHADELYKQGHTDLVFEQNEEEGQDHHYDIDVGNRLRDGSDQDAGRFDFGYQLKGTKVTSVDGASKKGTRQLVNAPAETKVVLMDVAGSQSELAPKDAQSLERRAERTGITQHLRFSDGTTRTFPEGASVYPSSES